MRTRAWKFVIALLTFGAGLASAQTGCNPNVFYQVCTSSLPGGTVGVSYGPQTLVASIGYEAANTWSIAAGQLPDGLTLDPVAGTISGVPATAGLVSFTVQADQAGVGSAPLTAQAQLSILIVDPLQITTTALPGGGIGFAYQAQLTATGGYSGVSPIWSTNLDGGAMPPGLSLSASGIITGTPTTIGTYPFTVGVSEADPQNPLYGYQRLSITIVIVPPLQIATLALPDGMVGSGYQQTLNASGGPTGGTQTWSLLAGSLPPGLSLAQSGNLVGTPTVQGSYPFVIEVVDQPVGFLPLTATRGYMIAITAAAPVSITTGSSLTAATVGIAYSQQIAATGGAPPYTWALDSGALPGGLGLNTSAGLISGTPATAGSYSFQLSVSDASGAKASRAFTLIVNPGLSISSGPALPGGASGTPYSTTLAATGGIAPYAWSVISQTGGLPPGLALDPATGNLSGTPTSSGSFQFTVGVSDAAQHTASKPMTLSIAAQLTISTTSPLANGTVGTAYQLQFAATGGAPAYTWSVSAGALPAGLALDPSTGVLTGTPTAAGPFNFTVGVKDGVQNVTKAFQLTIAAPPLPAVTINGLPDTGSPATQPALGVGLSGAYGLDLTGHATLTFTPDSGPNDPAVQFTSGGRTADFTIAAGTTQAVFGSSALGVQTGTVAGTITITLQLLAAGTDVTPTPAPTKVLRIPGAVPVITSAKLTATSTGFNLVVIGYSTTREVTGATVHLVAATGQTLATSDFTIALTSVFSPYYQDPNNAQFGSQFSLTIPFTVQSATNAISSLTVSLTNTQGTSTVANATF